ncbi:Ctsb [Symbiodinium pilosum]|uniref:Ctsb protein n=1 Tax=Symbiodinium pilosum TaxID=2952 RepID=A0A812WFW2_SYMPI|nr:Ctsb [Symbiodinium pilosum]
MVPGSRQQAPAMGYAPAGIAAVLHDGWAMAARCGSTLFVGPDSLHTTGALQPLVMTALGQGQDGRPFYQPATLKAFEEALWRQRGQDCPGLRWQLSKHRPRTEETRGMLLKGLEEILEQIPPKVKAGVLVFDADATLTYNELKRSSWTARGYDKLFILVGGAHGFDGANDEDGSFLEEVLRLFEAYVGPDNVAKVTLTEDATAATTFPLSKVVSFVSQAFSESELKQAGSFAAPAMGNPPAHLQFRDMYKHLNLTD